MRADWKLNIDIARRALQELRQMVELARSQVIEAKAATANAAIGSRAALAEADRVLAIR